MNPMHKRPAYIYAKDFKLNKVLGNLQAYRLATGDVDAKEIESVTRKYGADEGAIFGSLITSAAGQSKRQASEESNLKRRKRKRQKRKGVRGKEVGEESSSTFGLQTVELEEPLSIPQTLLAYSDTESEDDAGNEDGQSGDTSSSSGAEHDGKEQKEDADFFGLSNSQSSSDSEVDSSNGTVFPQERLETPTCTTQGWKTPTSTCTTMQSQSQAACQRSYPVCKDLAIDRVNNLSTFKCCKCRRVGHLAADCTAFLDKPSGSFGNYGEDTGPTHYQGIQGKTIYSPLLREYYQKCKKLQRSNSAKCAECGRSSNLGNCLECGLVLCDGRGHLIGHLLDYPSHTKWYSYKLQRQVKCCKSTCEVMDIDRLLMCSYCLDKFFNSHYSMVNATWSGKGLKAIPNALACEEHFHWHRMNCMSAGGELLATREKLETANHRGDGFLSEFYF